MKKSKAIIVFFLLFSLLLGISAMTMAQGPFFPEGIKTALINLDEMRRVARGNYEEAGRTAARASQQGAIQIPPSAKAQAGQLATVAINQYQQAIQAYQRVINACQNFLQRARAHNAQRLSPFIDTFGTENLLQACQREIANINLEMNRHINYWRSLHLSF